jgi:hypothetical protein
MSKANKHTIVVGPELAISGDLERHEVVRKVVNHFIDTEYAQKGKGVIFKYPVEKFSDGSTLMIERPGHKKNFDFKVVIEAFYGIQSGKHAELASDLKSKAEESPSTFKELWCVISELYHCRESDVDRLLQIHTSLAQGFTSGAHVETFVKILKWLFIMEDIVYWDNEGRAFLYNWLNYRSCETDACRLELATARVKKDPTALKKYLRELGMEWIPCEG